ncbi:28S ribosomal protein S30, mitochondrial-like [Stegodyphus dumicola]|uniref:28S ribosomal protein S30, mitochondrial-like n=1 Tax=Stegodyphus dumicola TaxID=202533 RepID=UPI0015AA2854|nr:28S ribosomal protein S30, mitochondrial-like [Stegodyphus dumicola]
MIACRVLSEKSLIHNVLIFRCSHALVVSKEDCLYPPIVDMSKEGQRRHNRQLWYDSIKALPTVEQKLYELAVQQRMKLLKYLLSSVPQTYRAVPFYQYITRTHFVDNLPERLLNMNVDDELNDIKSTLCDTLLKYYYNPWAKNKSKKFDDFLNEKAAGSGLVNMLISQCYKKLALKNDYILESMIQQHPRVSSFWWHSGFDSKEDRIYEKNLCFQYHDFPAFVIRMKKPLSPIVSLDDPLCATAEVPDYNYPPKGLGNASKRWHMIASVPGYWPGDPFEFPFLLVNTSDILNRLLCKLQYYNLKKIEDSVAMMSSFGWLNAVATYQGFTPFHDVSYPIVTHTILTNGQDWNFYVYQLNTIAFHSDVDKKDRRNICWSSGKMRLFDAVEDGKIKGINDEVFKMLLKCLLNAPYLQDNLVLKPYLGADDRSEEERKTMRFFLRRMNSRARDPKAFLEEIPTWARIYKYHPDAPPSPLLKLY